MTVLSEEELRKELEKMKEKLDREIQEAFRTAYEMYLDYKRQLEKEGRTMFIDVDGDCEVW